MEKVRTQRWLAGAWLLLALTAASCTQWQPIAGEGALTIVIPGAGSTTKAVSDITACSYEVAVNQLQLLLFRDDGTRCDYLSLDASSVSFPYTKQYPSLGAGTYRIYAVANGPDLRTVTTEPALSQTAVSLADCGLTDATGFVMMGGTEVQIHSGETSQANIPMSRFASRVRVTSIRNRLPAGYAAGGAMYIKGIFLINARETWTLGGTGTPSGWLNLGGREVGKAASTLRQDYISTAEQVPAAYRSHLFRTMAVSLARNQEYNPADACFYSFPNNVTVDHTGPDATEESGAAARLVVLATVNGEDWWYPITLLKDGTGLERNTTYDITLTICASGSADPNEPVVEARLVATLSCNAWDTGSSYVEPL